MASYYGFYDKTETQSCLAAQVFKNKYGSSITFVDTSGKNEAAMLALVTGLSADTYTKVFVCVGVAASHAEADFTYVQIAQIDAALITASKGSVNEIKDSGTAQANSTKTNIILAATASAVDDTYNGNYIVTDGTTKVYRYISDYTGSSTTATVADTGTAITTTETYIVYSLSNVPLIGSNASSGKTPSLQAWELAYPGLTAPELVHYMSGYKFAQDFGTAQAAAAGTITLQDTASAGGVIADGDRANDIFNDMYVYIYSATAGDGQVAKISDYVLSTEVCTLSANWDTTPTGTIVYRIMRDQTRILYDAYTELFVKTYFNDPTDTEQIAEFKNLIDPDDKLSAWTSSQAHPQNRTLLSEYITKGKAIYDYNAL